MGMLLTFILSNRPQAGSGKTRRPITVTTSGMIMKWRADSESLKPRSYEIKHDPLVGFYLYVFQGDRCVRDHLQDTLEIAMESALVDYDVPKDVWREVEG